MRNQLWRSDLQSYGFVQEMQPRYADIDTERHVNNVAVQGLHAEACIRFQLQLMAEHGGQAIDRLLHPVNIDTDFLRITHYQSPVQCGVRLLDVNEQSCTFALGLFQFGVCVGTQNQRVALRQAGRHPVLPDKVRMALLAHQAGQAVVATSPIADRSDIPFDIAAYPFISSLTPRFIDLDADGCTSTMALLAYAEQARSQLLVAALDAVAIDVRRGQIGMLVARTSIEMQDHRASQGAIRLAAGVARLGNSSFTMQVAAFDQQGCLATGESVIVFIRREDGKPIPLPEALRDYLAGQVSMTERCAHT